MKLRFLAGAAVGYVLGTRAGRERYQQFQEWFGRVAESDAVSQARAEFDKVTGRGATAGESGAVAPPVIVGPGPDGATGSPNTEVVLPDLESSTRAAIKSDIPATGSDEGPARRLDPPDGA